MNRHRNRAFAVETLLLTLFFLLALALLVQLFGAAHNRGVEERQLTQAVLLASNAAEEFAAMPLAGTQSEAFDGDGDALGAAADAGEGDYLVTREVVPEPTEGGTLYHASIAVSRDGEVVYELETARYASDGAAEGGDAA